MECIRTLAHCNYRRIELRNPRQHGSRYVGKLSRSGVILGGSESFLEALDAPPLLAAKLGPKFADLTFPRLFFPFLVFPWYLGWGVWSRVFCTVFLPELKPNKSGVLLTRTKTELFPIIA